MYSTSGVPFVEPVSSLPAYSQPNNHVSGPRRHTVVDGITYKIADCLEEREAAFRLVHEAYEKIGLMETNAHEMRVTPFHLVPTTDVFVAKDGPEVIHSVSFVGDGELGLPMEGAYPREVASRRDLGLRLAEPSCLASRQGYFSRTRMFRISTQVFGLAAQTARANGVDRLILAAHPRHGHIYTHSFGFEQIGGLKSYASVQGNPAVACEHDFVQRDENRYRIYDQIYRTKFAPWELSPKPMSSEELSYFAAAATTFETDAQSAAC